MESHVEAVNELKSSLGKSGNPRLNVSIYADRVATGYSNPVCTQI
jgi:hypothetical protein